MAATSTDRRRRSRPRPLRERPAMVLTPRDAAVLHSLWELRQLTRDQVQRLHFGGTPGRAGARSPSICLRRLGLMHRHGYLLARRMPVQQPAGSAPYVYALGPRAVPLIASWTGREEAEVGRRQRADARLAWLFFAHRRAITDVRIALIGACQSQGYGLRWQTDEHLAQLGERVLVDGRHRPVRPDGFFVIELGPERGRAAFFLEVQLASDPAAYRRKARAYMAYWGSGAYTARFGLRSLRVLAVTPSERRARQLQTAVEQVGGRSLFWSGALAEVQRDPFGAVWLVGGRTGIHGLLDAAEGAHRAVATAAG